MIRPVLAAVAAGLALTAAPVGGTAARAVAAAAPAASAATTAAKPPLSGLTTMGGAPEAGYPIANRVILVSWSALEPARGSFDFSPIDTVLAQARAAGQDAKLRVMAGDEAPGWATTLSGGTFSYLDGNGNPVPGMPHWWSPAYGTAYHELMVALAARYDADPTLREVALSRCMTQFAEPLWREFNREPADVTAALRAGYTDTADRACQTAMVTSDAAVWTRTNVDLALTGAAYIGSTGQYAGRAYLDGSVGATLAARLRATVGSRGLLENNELVAGMSSTPLYRSMLGVGPPFTFQVQNSLRLDGTAGLLAALHEGCDLMHARSVELAANYGDLTPAQLQPYADACSANGS